MKGASFWFASSLDFLLPRSWYSSHRGLPSRKQKSQAHSYLRPFLFLFPLPGTVFPRPPNSSGSVLTFHLLRGSSPNPPVPHCLTPACLAFFFALATHWNYIFTPNSMFVCLSPSARKREEGRDFNLIVHGCVTNTWHIVAHGVVAVIGLVCQAFPVSPSVEPGFPIAVANSLAEAVQGNRASIHGSGIQSITLVGVT